MNDLNIIIFDDECLLCNRMVQFIVKHDRKKLFYFTSMQSDRAHTLRKGCQPVTLDLDTIIVIKQKSCYQKSDAVLEIVTTFGGMWKIFILFKLIPRVVRDFFYDRVARHRYRLFGSVECWIPSDELKKRML